MVAVHGGGGALRRLTVMAVRRAHAADAAVQRLGLPRYGPSRGPEGKNGEQAKACGQFLSWSDRSLERQSHLMEQEEYRKQKQSKASKFRIDCGRANGTFCVEQGHASDGDS